MRAKYAIPISIAVAYFILTTEFRDLILALGSEGVWASVIVGFFFSSGLTTIPALASLALFGTIHEPFLVALFGALGATLADFVLFNLSDETVLTVERRIEKYPWIRRMEGTWYFRWAKRHANVVGGLIIASPLPDELAVLLWESAELPPKKFFLWAYVFNFIGIFLVASAARALT